MRAHDSLTRFAILFAGAVAFTACDSPGTGASTGATTSALAVAVAGQGSGSAHLRLTAISSISGRAEAVEHLAVQGGGTAQVVFDLPPASYTLEAETFADAEEQVRIGEGKASAQVSANATAVVNLKVDVERPGNGGGGGTITVDAHAAPVIAGLSVQGNGAGSLGSTVQLGGDGNASGKLEGSSEVTLQIDAHAEGGGNLHFFWSGAGLQGSLEGSASLTVSAQASAMLGVTTRVIYVAVQDDNGAAAALRIELDSTLLGGFTSIHASTQAAGGADAKISACLSAHASCVVACTAAAAADKDSIEARLSCLAGCGVELSSCESR